MIFLHRAAAMSVAVLTIAVALGASPARAVSVTVGGTAYNVEFFPGGESFDDNAATLSSTASAPWWGSSSQATAFANAYKAQVSTPYPFDVNPGFVDYLFFAHSTTGIEVDFAYLNDAGIRSNSDLGQTTGSSTFFYAYTTPFSAVPEIDGNALSQAGLILLALLLVLRGRRQGMV